MLLDSRPQFLAGCWLKASLCPGHMGPSTSSSHQGSWIQLKQLNEGENEKASRIESRIFFITFLQSWSVIASHKEGGLTQNMNTKRWERQVFGIGEVI